MAWRGRGEGVAALERVRGVDVVKRKASKRPEGFRDSIFVWGYIATIFDLEPAMIFFGGGFEFPASQLHSEVETGLGPEPQKAEDLRGQRLERRRSLSCRRERKTVLLLIIAILF